MFYRRIYELYNKYLAALSYRGISRSLSIESHMTVSELVRLYKLSKDIKVAAEIGSFIGASASSIGASFLQSGQGVLFCIDTWKNDAMSEGARDTLNEFFVNTKPFSSYIHPVRGFSTEVIDKVRERTGHLELLFIDGDHSYDGVKADWEAYKDFLKPGSIVVFHDYGWAEGVKSVVHEDVMPLVSSHDQLPNMWWGTLAKLP